MILSSHSFYISTETYNDFFFMLKPDLVLASPQKWNHSIKSILALGQGRLLESSAINS